jgi:hypothetical protein
MSFIWDVPIKVSIRSFLFVKFDDFGLYEPDRPGFEYNIEADRYECKKQGGQGAHLT